MQRSRQRRQRERRRRSRERRLALCRGRAALRCLPSPPPSPPSACLCRCSLLCPPLPLVLPALRTAAADDPLCAAPPRSRRWSAATGESDRHAAEARCLRRRCRRPPPTSCHRHPCHAQHPSSGVGGIARTAGCLLTERGAEEASRLINAVVHSSSRTSSGRSAAAVAAPTAASPPPGPMVRGRAAGGRGRRRTESRSEGISADCLSAALPLSRLLSASAAAPLSVSHTHSSSPRLRAQLAFLWLAVLPVSCSLRRQHEPAVV